MGREVVAPSANYNSLRKCVRDSWVVGWAHNSSHEQDNITCSSEGALATHMLFKRNERRLPYGYNFK